MKLNKADFYYRVSMERMNQAELLYAQGASFALAMYVAGVAVESMLRALTLRRDPHFATADTRMFKAHDLQLWIKASGVLTDDPAQQSSKRLGREATQLQARRLQGAASNVCVLWSNDYRFASEHRLRAHLKKNAPDRRIKGDFLKARARSLLDSAQILVTRGHFRWTSSKGSGQS
jgi:hypothetical protein